MVSEAAAIAGRLVRLAGLLVLAAAAYWVLRQTPLYEFTGRERDGLGTVILLIGNIYAVMFAFVIFVIWGQFTEVENFVMREGTWTPSRGDWSAALWKTTRIAWRNRSGRRWPNGAATGRPRKRSWN
jgi:hypothetical protein